MARTAPPQHNSGRDVWHSPSVGRPDQKRRGRGTSVGGRYAPDPRPVDPTLEEPLTVTNGRGSVQSTLPEATPIEATLPNKEPICLQQHNGKWEVQESWSTSELGLSLLRASANLDDVSSGATRILEGLLRGRVVADMLNDGDISTDDASLLLGRLDGGWGLWPTDAEDERADSFTPDSLWGAKWMAASRGEGALVDLTTLWERPSGEKPQSNWEMLTLRVKDVWQQAKGDEPSVGTVERAASHASAQMSIFNRQLDLLWGKFVSRNDGTQAAASASLSDLEEWTGLGGRFGTPGSVSEIYDRLLAAGATRDDAREHVGHNCWDTWLVMSKAHASDYDTAQMAQWMDDNLNHRVGAGHHGSWRFVPQNLLRTALLGEDKAAAVGFAAAWEHSLPDGRSHSAGERGPSRALARALRQAAANSQQDLEQTIKAVEDTVGPYVQEPLVETSAPADAAQNLTVSTWHNRRTVTVNLDSG